MITYASMPEVFRAAVLVVLLLCFWANLLMLLYSLRQKRKWTWAVIYGLAAAALDLPLRCVMETAWRMRGGHTLTGAARVLAECGWPAVAALFVLPVLLTGLGFSECLRFYKNNISPMSVKQSVDALPTGICFYYPNGRVWLKNTAMEEICRGATGQPLDSGSCFASALDDGSLQEGCRLQTAGEDKILSLPEGRVYLLRARQMQYGNQPITQLLAAEITEEYGKNADISRQQQMASRLNSQLRDYRLHIRDLSIEEELLHAKLRIHDELGETLLASKRYLRMGRDEKSRRELVQLLRKNVDLLRREEPERPRDEYEQLRQTARNVGVALELEGNMPAGQPLRHILCVAAHECLTNTLRHAHGDRLHVQLQPEAGLLCAEVRNNGLVPAGPIQEKGGLGILRTLVEKAGGTMEIESDPAFLLKLYLPMDTEEQAFTK